MTSVGVGIRVRPNSASRGPWDAIPTELTAGVPPSVVGCWETESEKCGNQTAVEKSPPGGWGPSGFPSGLSEQRNLEMALKLTQSRKPECALKMGERLAERIGGGERRGRWLMARQAGADRFLVSAEALPEGIERPQAQPGGGLPVGLAK